MRENTFIYFSNICDSVKYYKYCNKYLDPTVGFLSHIDGI